MLPVYVIIAEAKSKIIESLWQLFAEAKIVELRGLIKCLFQLRLCCILYGIADCMPFPIAQQGLQIIAG